MATITQLAQRRRPDARRIRSEEQAIAVAAEVLTQLSSARPHANSADHALRYPEVLSQSGLLGITVPSDAGGADITNASLSTLISQIATVDVDVAGALAGHFISLDALRAAASPARAAVYFERALHGDSFGIVDGLIPINGLHSHQPVLAEVIATNAVTDWIIVPLTQDKDRLLGIFQVPLDELGDVSADRLVTVNDNRAEALSHAAFQWMLQTAMELGKARRALSTALHDLQKRTSPAFLTAAVTIEAVAALLDKAGQALDVAQMSNSVERAEAAALAACHAAALGETLSEATHGPSHETTGSSRIYEKSALSAPRQALEIFYRSGSLPDLA